MEGIGKASCFLQRFLGFTLSKGALWKKKDGRYGLMRRQLRNIVLCLFIICLERQCAVIIDIESLLVSDVTLPGERQLTVSDGRESRDNRTPFLFETIFPEKKEFRIYKLTVIARSLVFA
jgi:hypothetical protein